MTNVIHVTPTEDGEYMATSPRFPDHEGFGETPNEAVDDLVNSLPSQPVCIMSSDMEKYDLDEFLEIFTAGSC